MAKSSKSGSGGGGRGSRGFRQAVHGALLQGRDVTVKTPGGLVTISNAPKAFRTDGIEFVATAQNGFGNGFVDSRATLTLDDLNSFLRQRGIGRFSRL